MELALSPALALALAGAGISPCSACSTLEVLDVLLAIPVVDAKLRRQAPDDTRQPAYGEPSC